MERGEVWWANLPDPAGSAPGYRRPVLVVQSNDFNRSRIQTVIVAAITGNLHLADAPGNVLCGRADTGLPKDSVINVSALLTIDRDLLEDRVRALPERLVRRVESGLKIVLDLT